MNVALLFQTFCQGQSKGRHFPFLCPTELKHTCWWVYSLKRLETGIFLSRYQREFHIVKCGKKQKAAFGELLPEGNSNHLLFTNNCFSGWSHFIVFHSFYHASKRLPKVFLALSKGLCLFLLQGQISPSRHRCRSQGPQPSAPSALSSPAQLSQPPPGCLLISRERLLTF